MDLSPAQEHASPRQSRRQDPEQPPQWSLPTAKIYHPAGRSQIYPPTITAAICPTKIGKYQFLVPSQFFDNIIKKDWRYQTLFASNKFVRCLHRLQNNKITIWKLITQIYLIFAARGLEYSLLRFTKPQELTYLRNFLPKFRKIKSHGRDEAVLHTTELFTNSSELICSFDFSKPLFRNFPPFSINKKVSYNYQKIFVKVVMSLTAINDTHRE